MDDELQRRLLAALERPHRLGMIGGDLVDHVTHAAAFGGLVAEVLGPDRAAMQLRAGDLGTGGGIPGVVLAAMWPAWYWTLIDVRSARAQEVEATVHRLGLEANCDVVASAAQELGQTESWRESFDVVVARAFGTPALLAECATGLLLVGGVLVVSEPPAAVIEERWPEDPLAALGFGPAEQATVDGSHFAVITKIGPTPPQYPRVPPRADRGWPKTA